MIKVIASDLDGTLLGADSKLAPCTVKEILHACDMGIRFMVVTGRDFKGTIQEIEETGLVCDYILVSGAEVRDPQQKIVSRIWMDIEVCGEIYEILKEYPVSITFMTEQYDYGIGKPENFEENLLEELRLTFPGMTFGEIIRTEMYQNIKKNTQVVSDFQKFRNKGAPVYKIFVYGNDIEVLREVQNRLMTDRRLAVAPSSANNLEITDARAQKGPVLKAYIESLGYTMDEVMVFGDSMNDYSMMAMNFGATIAMENSDPQILAAAKYVTKSNREHGVAYVINEMFKCKKYKTMNQKSSRDDIVV